MSNRKKTETSITFKLNNNFNEWRWWLCLLAQVAAIVESTLWIKKENILTKWAK